MINNVTVNVTPINLPESKKNSSTWKIRYQLAKEDLEVAQQSILRNLEQNIPVNFSTTIVLTLRISLTTFKIKIDYSQIKSLKQARLIKLYLSGDMENFASEWLKLG